MKLLFEKVSENQFNESMKDNPNIADYSSIKIPRRATYESAGYDFYTPFSFTLQPGESVKIPTGIRILIEGVDAFLALFPRSGLGSKYRLQLNNTVGIIDKDYYYSSNEGHIYTTITNDGNKTLSVSKGEAYCQGIIIPFIKTLDDDRYKKVIRDGGMGSTDNVTIKGDKQEDGKETK